MPSKPSVYWDSSVFIDWMKRDKPDRLPGIQQVVDAAERGELLIVTSTMTIVEVVRTDDGRIVEGAEDERIVDFLKNPYFEVRLVDRRTAERARKLQRAAAAANLSLPKRDAVHLATALVSGVPVLHTFDERHLIPHSRKWGDPPLLIETPCWSVEEGPAPEPSMFPMFDDPAEANA